MGIKKFDDFKHINKNSGTYTFIEKETSVVECYITLLNGLASRSDLKEFLELSDDALNEMIDLMEGNPKIISEYYQSRA